jgi:hypothetical protein
MSFSFVLLVVVDPEGRMRTAAQAMPEIFHHAAQHGAKGDIQAFTLFIFVPQHT